MKLPVSDNSRRPGPGAGAGERRLPPWLRKRLPAGAAVTETRRLLERLALATVCSEAKCPNLPECWSKRTATFMIMGRRCTRRCRFCSVATGRPEPLRADEPARVAEAAAALGLRHVVITSVCRDDLPDEGADHFHRCVVEVRRRLPGAVIEVLPPDLHARRECIARVQSAAPTVFNHNIETVRRLTAAIRPQADYERSLAVLRTAKEFIVNGQGGSPSPSTGEGKPRSGAGEGALSPSMGEGKPRSGAGEGALSPSMGEGKPRSGAGEGALARQERGEGGAVDSRSALRFTKSGLMVGLGEATGEVFETLADLRSVGCDIVTIGQYLRPTPRSAPVRKYYHPDEFDALGEAARRMGFVSVASGPFVRSSYNAGEVYEQAAGRAPTCEHRG